TAHVNSAASVSVNAHSAPNFTLHTGQISVGVGAAGAAFSRLTADGSVSAQVGGGAQIGQQLGHSVGSLSVTADSTIDANAPTVAVAVGGGTVSANFSFVTVSVDTEASIGGDAHIKVSGDLTVKATSIATATAKTPGVSAGVVTLAGMLP